jgi:hypothetical protein
MKRLAYGLESALELITPAALFCAVLYAAWKGHFWLAVYLFGAFMVLVAVNAICEHREHMRDGCTDAECSCNAETEDAEPGA